MEQQERRRSLTILRRDRSLSHLPRSRPSTMLFPDEDTRRYAKGGEASYTPTSRRYGVTADTKRRRDVRALSDNFPRVRTAPEESAGGGGWNDTRGDVGCRGQAGSAEGIPYGPSGNRRVSSFARRSRRTRDYSF